MSTRYEIDYSEIVQLEQKMARLPNVMERVVNDTIHNDGIEIVNEEINKFLPVSNRNKKHAKTSKWSKSEKSNLEFTIKSKGGSANKKGSFGYLVFPNEGRGPLNKVEQRFMEKGLVEATPRILEKLNRRIDEKLGEELQ